MRSGRRWPARIRARRLNAIVLALVTLSGSAPAAGAWLNRDALIAAIEAVRAARAMPAVGLALIDDGAPVVVHAWGHTGNPAAPEAGPDTVFRVGSITKTVTALTALRLAEQRQLDLDDPLGRFDAARLVTNPWPEPVRIVHLLELSAGLPDLTRAEFDSNVPLDLAAALARAGPRAVLWPPGLVHGYTNVAPGLTAHIVETVTGERFEGYAARVVLRPLGMNATTFEPDAATRERLARGYTAGGEREIPYWHMTFRAFGALNASTRDMARLVATLANAGMSDGRPVFAPMTIARMMRPESTLAARAGLEVGYGKGIYARVSGGHVLWTHGGDADGFRSRFAVLPAVRRGYYVVINADDVEGLEQMVTLIERSLLADLTPPAVPPVAALRVAELDQWAGRYYPARARFGIEAWREGDGRDADIERVADRLVLSPSGRRPITLWPVSERLYRRSRDPLATAVFVRDAEGAIYLFGEAGDYVRVSPGPCPAYLAGMKHCPIRPEAG